MPVLHAAFDDLVGIGRWIPRKSLGGFPIRFPHSDDPGDTGWHVDASFSPDQPVESYSEWRINLRSKGRALLMLFLFSDVGERDAPTRIRLGSHLHVARLLAPAGELGMSFMDLGAAAASATEGLGSRMRPDHPERCIYVIHSWCMRHNRIAAPLHAFWRSRRCIHGYPLSWNAVMGSTHWWKGQSVWDSVRPRHHRSHAEGSRGVPAGLNW